MAADAGGIVEHVEFLDTNAHFDHAAVLQAKCGDALGGRFDEIDVPLAEQSLDAGDDVFVGHHVGDVVIDR